MSLNLTQILCWTGRQ